MHASVATRACKLRKLNYLTVELVGYFIRCLLFSFYFGDAHCQKRVTRANYSVFLRFCCSVADDARKKSAKTNYAYTAYHLTVVAALYNQPWRHSVPLLWMDFCSRASLYFSMVCSVSFVFIKYIFHDYSYISTRDSYRSTKKSYDIQ